MKMMKLTGSRGRWELCLLTQDFEEDFVGNPFTLNVGRDARVLSRMLPADG